MMGHLTTQELEKFRSRTLDAQRLLLADRHLARCQACRRQFRAAAPPPALPPIVEECGEPLHPSYEQICAYLEAPSQSPAWQLVEAHIAVCPACALEVRDLRELDAKLAEGAPMKTMEEPPARRPFFQTIAHRLFHSQSPAFAGVALSALAAGLFLISSPAPLPLGTPIPGPETESLRSTASLQTLAGVVLVLAGGAGFLYRWLKKQ